jgi:streptogramin lyase
VLGLGAWLPNAWAANDAALPAPRSITELAPEATFHVGKTADWVAIGDDAVWVASTGPYAAHRIDPKTNRLVASVMLPGEPCAGLALGFGSLWVPMCMAKPSLAKVDATANRVAAIFPVGPAAAEGGVTTGADSVWLMVDKSGTLAGIDPETGTVRRRVKIPAGSYNPYFSEGTVWVTHQEGAEITGIGASSARPSEMPGEMQGVNAPRRSIRTGPHPRFLTGTADAIWTLNQGDGSLTRIDLSSLKATTIALGTPGHGGDIGSGGGVVWTTMPKMPLSATDAATQELRCRWSGPGGDSLGIGHEAIWLTDYHAGTLARIGLKDALAHCAAPPR